MAVCERHNGAIGWPRSCYSEAWSGRQLSQFACQGGWSPRLTVRSMCTRIRHTNQAPKIQRVCKVYLACPLRSFRGAPRLPTATFIPVTSRQVSSSPPILGHK